MPFCIIRDITSHLFEVILMAILTKVHVTQAQHDRVLSGVHYRKKHIIKKCLIQTEVCPEVNMFHYVFQSWKLLAY